MNNILCKIGFHKWQKVKSTETNMMNIMSKILEVRNEYFAKDEDVICRKFDIKPSSLSFGYEVSDYVCVRPGCSCCDYRVDRKRNRFIERRNDVVRSESKSAKKDELVEKIYKEDK